MKTKHLIIVLLLAVAVAVSAQQFTARVTTNVDFPTIRWSGSNAQVIADQLLSITNADGTTVVPSQMFSSIPHATVTIVITNGTDGVKTIQADIK